MVDPAVLAAAKAILGTIGDPGVTWETVGEQTRKATLHEATEAVAAWCKTKADMILTERQDGRVPLNYWLRSEAAAFRASERQDG